MRPLRCVQQSAPSDAGRCVLDVESVFSKVEAYKRETRLCPVSRRAVSPPKLSCLAMATINASFVSAPRSIEQSNTAASPIHHQTMSHAALMRGRAEQRAGSALEKDLEKGAGAQQPHAQDLARSDSPDEDRDDLNTLAEAAAGNPELAIQQLLSTYNAAVARAISYDNFIWSTPGVTLAAHAFLFSIALAGVNSQASRIISMILSLLISLIIFQVFARHRQAEVAMSVWLQAFELRHSRIPNGILFPQVGNCKCPVGDSRLRLTSCGAPRRQHVAGRHRADRHGRAGHAHHDLRARRPLPQPGVSQRAPRWTTLSLPRLPPHERYAPYHDMPLT